MGIVILAIIVALISQRSLTSLNVSWEKTSFEVGESTTVKITPEPVDFDLSNISISDDEFASFEFSDGIATVTFKKEGRGTLYFSCGNISSDEYQIEVIDPVAEEQRQKEAQEKAEEEARLEENVRLKSRQNVKPNSKRLFSSNLPSSPINNPRNHRWYGYLRAEANITATLPVAA